MEEVLKERQLLLEKLYPYSRAGEIQLVRKYGQILEESYQDDGILVKAYVPRELWNKIQ